MRKRLLFLTTLTAVIAPVGVVISCGANTNTTKNAGNEGGTKNDDIGKPIVDKEPKHTGSIKFRQQVINTMFKDVAKLKAADKWWDIPKDRYGGTARRVKGRSYYVDLKKKDDKWGQLNLEDWIDVYDTDMDNISKDPNHKYASTAPYPYESQLPGTPDIYGGSPTDPEILKRTGNNANPRRGLYTGSVFYMVGTKKYHLYTTAQYIIGHTPDFPDSVKGTDFPSRSYNNWEHVSPASQEGQTFVGPSGIRDNYSSSQWPKSFKRATGDLHNLRPSWAGTNQPRRNYAYGIIPGNSFWYGAIDFEVGHPDFDPSMHMAEPRVGVRGDVARIIFYMHDRYHVRYDIGYYRQLLLWARMDPVSPEEIALDKKIAKVMGFHNDYVTSKKTLPYDATVEKLVEAANRDNSAPEFTWSK